MRAMSYRAKFLEVLCEVCDLSAKRDWPGEYHWTADYFSRSARWYRFRGNGNGSTGATEGRMLDTDTGHVQHLSSSLLTFVMLEFDTNELIAAYTGPALPAVCIAQDLVSDTGVSPEVLAIAIERVDDTDQFKTQKIATSLLFVGFEQSKDAGRIRHILAKKPEMVSRHWFHDRHLFLPRVERVEAWSRPRQG